MLFLYHITLNLVKSKCFLTANFDTYFYLFNINTKQKRCGSITNHDYNDVRVSISIEDTLSTHNS